MNRLRDKLKHLPKHNIIIKQRFIHHNQPFLYQYHSLKLEFAKKFPTLINYLKNINKNLPEDIFRNSERISQISKQASKETPTTMARRGGGCPLRGAEQGFCEALEQREQGSKNVKAFFRAKTVEAIFVVGVSDKIITKQNYAVELAKLAASITHDNKKRHQIIENFMLINDTATIATEVPVYFENFTGHIDILQVRYHKIFILDYKPEPLNKQQAITQLNLYRKALSKRTNIPKYKIKLAFFNDKGYYEFS